MSICISILKKTHTHKPANAYGCSINAPVWCCSRSGSCTFDLLSIKFEVAASTMSVCRQAANIHTHKKHTAYDTNMVCSAYAHFCVFFNVCVNPIRFCFQFGLYVYCAGIRGVLWGVGAVFHGAWHIYLASAPKLCDLNTAVAVYSKLYTKPSDTYMPYYAYWSPPHGVWFVFFFKCFTQIYCGIVYVHLLSRIPLSRRDIRWPRVHRASNNIAPVALVRMKSGFIGKRCACAFPVQGRNWPRCVWLPGIPLPIRYPGYWVFPVLYIALTRYVQVLHRAYTICRFDLYIWDSTLHVHRQHERHANSNINTLYTLRVANISTEWRWCNNEWVVRAPRESSSRESRPQKRVR